MNIDEQIANIPRGDEVDSVTFNRAVMQFIRDVLDEVMPEVQGPVQDGKFVGAIRSDWNACRNEMLDKRKELGL